ncbi:hypothetical protein Q4Q34_03950 [Flavivirga abyssicola]|uniref:DUF6970 domain-containing protein n=1 Tax=Flavivirga abyssicola TaxID=3063533 RepID=UPI0026DF1849|nr:hypothetical protein [Flavivirga sp. MEBiC07777]WVK14182.1 hypothetical protein Q4Q34_03950 [Flavivirga sp. MEBiC07777]
MKNHSRKLVVVILFCIISCKDDDAINYPDCLKPIINVILERRVQSPKANIEKYIYMEEEVFLVNGQNFPDGQSHLITLECNDICVFGGIDGPDNDCPDWQNAEFVRTVWTDPR